MRAVAAAALAASVAGVAAPCAERLLADRMPRWRRVNFRGRPVTLSGGAAAACGVLAGSGLAVGPARGAALLAGAAAAAAGGYDDLCAREAAGDKGLAGHLAAARAGRLSGGVVKVAALGAAAVAAARLLGPWTGVPVRAVLIAGGANLVNLLDLRPGRAGKVTALGGLLGVGGVAGPLGAAAAGAAMAVLPADLAERAMLGDLGANALGAVLGVRLAAARAPVRAGAAALILGLTAASERVSFSRVIDATPALRRLDRAGRRA